MQSAYTYWHIRTHTQQQNYVFPLFSSNKPGCILLCLAVANKPISLVYGIYDSPWLLPALAPSWNLRPRSEPRLEPFARASWPQHQARLPDFSSETAIGSIWIISLDLRRKNGKQTSQIHWSHGIAAWPSSACKSTLPSGMTKKILSNLMHPKTERIERSAFFVT